MTGLEVALVLVTGGFLYAGWVAYKKHKLVSDITNAITAFKSDIATIEKTVLSGKQVAEADYKAVVQTAKNLLVKFGL